MPRDYRKDVRLVYRADPGKFCFGIVNIFDINTGAVHFAGNLPYNIYSAESVFYRDKIYIYGGEIAMKGFYLKI